MRTLRTSVRRLVEFLLRSGDIDSENDWRGNIDAMQAGSNIHRMLQASAGEAYQAEVPLAGSIYFPNNTFNPYAARLEIHEDAVRDQEGLFLVVEGRADGIIDDGVHSLTIDEIKGVSRDVSDINAPATIHESQALCYAYLYLRQTRGAAALSTAHGEQVTIRLTYASMTTGEVRQLEHAHRAPDIEAWFFSLLQKAQRWAAWRVNHDQLRKESLSSLTFPLKPRDSQQEIMSAVSSAIHEGRRLYLQAPTGSGKTIATLYPALKAIGSGEVSRVAFLTAKTMTRRAALECLDLFKQQGITANILVVTARNKICLLRSNAQATDMRARPLASLCNPIECPLARGHYDLVNDALYEAITTYDVLDSHRIEEVAARHHVCPYELQRDVARWSDIIVCDYHYAFAPSASLLGLAGEPNDKGTVYLVDEAHNLVDRMRDMYSADLAAADLEHLERLLRTSASFEQVATAVRQAVSAFPVWNKALPKGTGTKTRTRRSDYQVVRTSDELLDCLSSLADGIDDAFEQFSPTVGDIRGHEHQAGVPSGGSIELFLTLRDMSLKIRAFLAALQRAEAGYVTFLSRSESGSRQLEVFCVNPSHDLGERLEQAKAAIFFSGTLLPMDYHRKLLAAQDGDAALYIQSSFDHRLQQVLIGTDVSTRFSQRGPELYSRVARYLMSLVRACPGNYLVFLPSYAMMEKVEAALRPLASGEVTFVRQHPNMRESERERFVARFRETHATSTSLVGLCVLGGIFGESIDLPGKMLVGVVVVGTGMPMATAERELIRDYFDAKEGEGFAYAYTYPGLNKVLQAAGRLIRTEKDRGVILLLDDRFLEAELQEALPKEWKGIRTCTLETMPILLASTAGASQQR